MSVSIFNLRYARWEGRGRWPRAKVGFRQVHEEGAALTLVYDLLTDVRVVVRGDDFTFAGTEVELGKVQAKMRDRHDVKVRGTRTHRSNTQMDG